MKVLALLLLIITSVFSQLTIIPGTLIGTNDSSEAATHYGNPKNGCLKDEISGGVQGADGVCCLPNCTKNDCPTDEPTGTTAFPMCAVSDGKGHKYCVLQCKGVHVGKCPKGSKCTLVGFEGAAICLYPDSSKGLLQFLELK